MFYAIGALFIVGPVAGWLLMLLVVWRFVSADPKFRAPSMVIWLWWAMMLVIFIGLVVAHLDFRLSTGQTVKSAIGWAKGWAMFAVFLTAGACLNIRLAALARAANILGLQTLILAPFLIAAAYGGLPSVLWVSPLKAVGGPGPEFFSLVLYGVQPDGAFRWAFFAPWAPGAGIAAIVMFALGMTDRDWRWRSAGMLGGITIALMVKSRLAMIGLPGVMIGCLVLTRLNRPAILGALALACLVAGLAWFPLTEWLKDAKEAFEGYRANSTEVRATLQAIAKHRFLDAPIWGHAVQDKGMHLVQFMPIGSHHTWNGLLFVKGLVGAVSFAAAMIATTAALVLRGHRSKVAGAGLACFLAMWLYSFGENVEVLVYLFWVGLLAAGRGVAAPRQPEFNAYDPTAIPAMPVPAR